MNILYVAQWAGADKYGMVYGHYHLARQWVNSGHLVTIIAASFSHTRHRQPNIGWFKDEYINGIRYIWVPVNKYSSSSAFGRLFSIAVFSVLCFFVRLRARFDVVISSSHHPFSIFYSFFIAKRHSAKLVFEVRDLWPLSLIELGKYSPLNPIIVLMGLAERFAYKTADIVISTLQNGICYMAAKGLKTERFIYIPNGAVRVSFSHSRLHEQLANALVKNRFVISYCGNLGVANNLSSLIGAAEYLPSDKYIILIIGDGPDVARLRQEACRFKHVLFFPRVSRSEVAAVLEQSDLAFISYAASPLYKYGISPTKLGDYASIPVPILFSADFNLGELEGVEGLFRCKDSPSGIAEAVKEVSSLNAEALRKSSFKFSQWYFSERAYEKLALRYLDSFL